MKDCHNRNDLNAAFRVEKLASMSKTSLTINAYDSFLMLCLNHGDDHAFQLFEELLKIGKPSNGLCLGLLSKCAESKFCRFADMIVQHLRENNDISIQAYSALMKAYASCGMYNKACDLYAQVVHDGLKPDSVMYGCLMKFAVACGRTELSQELSKVAPQLDIHNYMSLIQAAGRDKDIDHAFRVVEDMKAKGVKVDLTAYSCVLDVCVSVGDLKRAKDLLAEMCEMGSVDVVAYNTMLKGYCNSGDSAAATAIFSEMDEAGIQPNDVSFNCLMNAYAVSGNFKQAWSLLEMMDTRGLKIGNFTMSILMKALKKARSPHWKDVAKAFGLLDRLGADVYCDEVVLNVVLETCIRHREHGRLNTILTNYLKSSHRPSLHSTGLLIKSASALNRIDICRELWADTIGRRSITPNDYILGDMLDALVCNDCVEEACTLLDMWKEKITPNMYVYTAILKGLANTNQIDRAMELYEEIKESGVSMNATLFSVLIDMQARTGDTRKVFDLVQCMKSKGCKPDDVTSAIIVKSYAIKGDIDEAFRVFRDLQKDGMQKDSLYNAILNGSVQHNRMDLADLVIEDLEKYNIKPSNFTLGILMKMYGRRKQVQKAFDVLEHLSKKHGLTPNIRVKNCLMCNCLSNSEMEKAYEVFEDIKRSGQDLDAKTYSALIQANTKLGNFDEAVRLCEEACDLGKQRGLRLSQILEGDAVEQLLRAIDRRGRTHSISLRFLENMRDSDLKIQPRIIRAFLKQ
jgi:pentatricopeptide repeat protein